MVIKTANGYLALFMGSTFSFWLTFPVITFLIMMFFPDLAALFVITLYLAILEEWKIIQNCGNGLII